MKSRPSKFESLSWDNGSADPLFAVSVPADAVSEGIPYIDFSNKIRKFKFMCNAIEIETQKIGRLQSVHYRDILLTVLNLFPFGAAFRYRLGLVGNISSCLE